MIYRFLNGFHVAVANWPIFFTVHTEDGPVEQHRETYFLEATTDRGDRYQQQESVNTEAEAENLLAQLPESFNPKTAEGWGQGEPVYGSLAWDNEAEYNLACFEADCFNEPRPPLF